jgi:predicted permease
MCAPFPTLEGCMAYQKPVPNHTINPNSPKQVRSLVHLCAFSQQVIFTLLTHVSKGSALTSNKFLYSTTSSLFVYSFFARLTNSNTFVGLCEEKGIQGQ